LRLLACVDCGAELVGPKRGKLPATPRCQRCKAAVPRRQGPRVTQTATCEQCAAVYEFKRSPTGPMPARRFCSPRCRNRWHYEQARADGRYHQWLEATSAKQAAKRPVRRCAICDEPMALGKRKLCGADACFRRYHAGRMSAYTQMRRAQMAGVGSEKFANAEVYERDDWTCGICGGDVPPDARFPDPLSASLDHVVPLSKGGAHTRANTRCSHLICNMRKGAQEAA
jgi:hypothetical protein